MTVYEETVQAIDRTDLDIWKREHYNYGIMGVELHNDGKIYTCNGYLCDVEVLSMAIKELEMYREAIKEVTGIEF